MPNLDFSDVIGDSDLNTTFSVIQRLETVGAHGRLQVTETRVDDVEGVVTVGDSGNILRLPEGQMTTNMITVTTKFRLCAATEGRQPDVIIYDGIRFTVKALKRWTQLGDGFVKAVAESGNASDPAPN